MARPAPPSPPTPSWAPARARGASTIATVVLLLVGISSCSTGGTSGGDGPPSTTAAVVDDQAISIGDVDARIRQQLFEEEFADDSDRLYAARRATVDRMIDERLLARAAAETGTTPEAYLETALAGLPPIQESDLQALFDANKDRLPADATIDPYREQLRDHLREQRIHDVYARLREDASIRVTLPRERIEVAATGPSLGPAEAPVTIVEFSDFQCPFCGRAVPVVEALHARYPDTVRIVYRHLPLSFHENARLAAIASVCADEQGRFWDYHDRLFADQKALAREDLIAHAEALGLDRAAFEACLVAPGPAAVVDADLRAAEEAGATGTPTFFVNGLKLTGARPVEQFEEIVDEELERLAR